MLTSAVAACDRNDYAFTIVGSGFAGFFLAEKLAKLGRVLVIEAGTLEEPLAWGNGYYEIESTGIPMPTLGARLSAVGGTSNHWTGQCRPFSQRIFRNRDEIGIAGWPIQYRDYEVHLGEAQAWLNLPRQFESSGGELTQGLLADHRSVAADLFWTPDPVPKLCDPTFRARFLAHPAIDILPGMRVTDLFLETGEQAVSQIETAAADGSRLRIPVRRLLLCAGGIENARLLLWSGRKYAPGNPFLGGPNELTGKYYAEHPVYWPVEVFFDHRLDLSHTLPNRRGGVVRHLMWRPDDAFFERHRLPRFAALIHDDGTKPTEGAGPATDDEPWLRRADGYRVAVPALKFEQTPYERSCVLLSEKRDRDGTPIARVHWDILPADLVSYRRATVLFCGLLNQRGFIRTRLRQAFRADDWSAITPTLACHHLGATRMAHAPKAGVVDADCKVFGLTNLFIAGSSVFANGGDYVNPTMNFLALAARLAATLTARYGEVGQGFRFGYDRPENRYLIEGWSHAEDLGIWSEGHESRMVLPAAGARRLQMRGRAYREVELALTVNGNEVFRGLGKSIQNFECDLDGSSECEMIFSFPSPTSPADFGESDDQRKLGYFIKSVELS